MNQSQQEAWDDWGRIDPLYAILTDPRYRHNNGDLDEFFAQGDDFVEHIMRRVAPLGRPVSFRRALDFGCGVGRLTRALAYRFDDVLGLDIAQSMVDSARELSTRAGLANCRFSTHRGADLRDVPTGSVDLVLCVLVLQHLTSSSEIERYISEFIRVLAPGGMAVIQLPNKVVAPPERPTWRTKSGRRTRLAQLLRKAGVDPYFLYRHLPWTPAMTMTGLPPERVDSVVQAAGGRILDSDGPELDAGGTEGWMYYAAGADSH